MCEYAREPNGASAVMQIELRYPKASVLLRKQARAGSLSKSIQWSLVEQVARICAELLAAPSTVVTLTV